MIRGLRGPNLTIAQGEGSSVGAIATACRMLGSGAAEALLAGGADDLAEPVYEAYDRLGVLSRDREAEGGGPEGSRPFDRTRNGFVCGEAACLLFLEPEERALARGARRLGIIEGFAEGRSRATPQGVPRDAEPLARVILDALESAGADPGSIGAVLASANSTVRLDALEAEALRLAFGGAPPPVMSVRGAIGESGAAGAISALAACFALAEEKVPGTAGLSTVDPGLGLAASPAPGPLRDGRVLVTGFSRGGSAAVLVMSAV
jgi:3-oxoacyl-[acyl-carrier-protein] synthase II